MTETCTQEKALRKQADNINTMCVITAHRSYNLYIAEGAVAFRDNRIKNEVDIAKNAVSISFIFAI